MPWLFELFTNDTITHSVLIICLIAGIGLFLGSLSIFRVKIGLTAVLFVGLLLGHFQVKINHEVLEFVREFGLVIFVFTVGTQVGPSFFASLQKNGLRLNLLAASIVVLGGLVTLSFKYITPYDPSILVGLFSGATTNTPSLGAAQQMLKDLLPNQQTQTGLAYAVAYPFGIIGIILTFNLIKLFFKININAELSNFSSTSSQPSTLTTMNILVTNPNIVEMPIKKIPSLKESGVMISRVFHNDLIQIATSESLISKGDTILAVGTTKDLDALRIIIGTESTLDLRSLSGQIMSKRIIITSENVVGKTPKDLDLWHRYRVTLTRLQRAEIEITPNAHTHFQFADKVTAVGAKEDLEQAAKELGNSARNLNHPHIIPFFIGIVLGVILGSYPFFIPGVPIPVKLGMAGGPLLVAIMMSRIGHLGPVIWHMPTGANLVLREFGMLLFLSCVGLKAGEQFFATLMNGQGFIWMGIAAIITLIPILTVGAIARFFFKLNYLSLCGLLAGSMTDPPALAYTNESTQSDIPSIAYATVYPLTMLLRVVGAQLLVILML